MPQLSRLAIVFAVLITGYVVARLIFVPETFGDRGHYRAAVVDEIVAQPIKYAGHWICWDCHDDIFDLRDEGYHRDLRCEVCHGPSLDHVEDEDLEIMPVVPRERVNCPLCHGYDAARPTGLPQVEVVTHNPGEPCYTCHNPHNPVPLNVPEECSACHGTIARTKAISHHAPLPCEQCHQTDVEHKSNPRVIRSTKPVTRELCNECHAESADPPEEIVQGIEVPRIDVYTHFDTTACWQCHYTHRPEVY
jgi:hypothetical protein